MSISYFEFIGEDDRRGVMSSKFWEVTVDGTTVTVRFGKIGASGQTTVKSYSNPEEAQAEADKLVAAKTKKGYVRRPS